VSGPDEPGPDTGRDGDRERSRKGKGLRAWVARALVGFDAHTLSADLESGRAELVSLREDLRNLAEDLGRTGRGLHEAVVGLQGEVEALRDGRVPSIEARLDRGETHAAGVEERLGETVDRLEHRLDELEGAAAELGRVAAEIRDERLPAAVRRADALIDRLALQVEEAVSLAERVAAREPLPLPPASPAETSMSEELAAIQPVLLERLRGAEAEIAHRLEAYLPLLEGHEPVLDLGCGRGELLGLLTERGTEATGIEADPVLAASARRKGLRVVEGDVLEVLLRLGDGATGAVTAIHLFEHLTADRLLRVLAEIRRILRPGGVLLAECPNPATLRVGAEEFWNDPTHVRPMPARLLEVLLAASGFAVEERRFLRPFPDPERLPAPPAEGAQDEVLRYLEALRRRLDEIVNGPRDYLLVARRGE